MRDFLRELQSFNGVAAGQTANLSVPVGGSVYHSWFIEYLHTASTEATEAQFKSDVENVKIKVNGEPLWDISGTDLVDLNNYYGYPMANGHFPIMFARPEFLDPNEELRFALGTADVNTLTLELKMAAGAVAPELSAHALLLNVPAQPLGQVVRVRKTPQTAQAASGWREIHDLPVTGPASDRGRGLKALHIRSGNIGEHDIELNGGTISETPSDLNSLVADIRAFQTVSRNDVANTYHVDFAGNRYSGHVPTAGVNDFRLKLNFTGAEGAFDIIHEETVGVPKAA